MLVRAKLQDGERTFGFCNVAENAQVVQWGGSMFIHVHTNERMTDAGRKVFRTYQRVSTDVEVVVNLEQEF